MSVNRNPRKTNVELTKAIFQAAIGVLQSDGYENVTFSRIAAQAQTSRAVLYRRWQSPFALLLDATDYFDDPTEHAQIDFSGHTLRENLINSLLHFNASQPFLRAVLIELGQDNPIVHHYFESLHQQQLYIMERILSQAQLTGEIKHTVTDNVKLLPFNELLYQAMIDQQEVSVSFATSLVDQIVLPAILAQQSESN